MGKFFCCLFKSSIFWLITTILLFLLLIIGINISIAYLWSFLIDKFLSSYLYLKYLKILILFFFNYFLIRKIVITWLFEWQFPFQVFSIYRERQVYLTILKRNLINFISALEVLLDTKYKISNKEIKAIESFLQLFEEEFIVYDRLYKYINDKNNNNNKNNNMYKMSKCQIKYYNLLKAIKHIFNENNTKDNLLKLKDSKDDFLETLKMNAFTANQNFENKKNLTKLNMLLKIYKNIIEKYDMKNYTYLSPSYYFNLLFNDTFGSLSLYSFRFKNKFEKYIMEENFTPKGKVHYALLMNKQKDNFDYKQNNDILLLFCLPNGGCYELFPKSKIEFYINSGFSFLCWNYKGYGYTKGRANFSNVKTDVLDVYDCIVNNPKYNFRKICVMGHSIGGVAACYLAKNRHVDLLISDRNFCDITRLVNNLFSGRYLSKIIKCLFLGKTDNIQNFCSFSGNENKIENNIIKSDDNLKSLNRIIIYAPDDMLILNDATLKSGVARYIINNYIIYKNNGQIIKNKENLLDIVFNKTDKLRFVNNFLYLIHFYYDKSKNKRNKSKDIILDINSKNNKSNSNEYINLNQSDQFEEETLSSFFDKFSGICCDDLNYLSKNKLSSRRELIFLDNFFNNLLIWGTQAKNDNKEENFIFHSEQGKKALLDSYQILNKFISNKNDQINISKISNLLNLCSEDIKKILDVMDSLDIDLKKNINKDKKVDNNIFIDNDNSLKEKLINTIDEINKNEINDISNIDVDTSISSDYNINNNTNFYVKLNNIKGNIKLFKTSSGHNGLLTPEEKEQYYKILLSTGIIEN